MLSRNATRRSGSTPNLAFAHCNLATFLALHPDPVKARPSGGVEHSRKAVELEPATGSFVNTLAIALYRAGLGERAAATFRKSMEVNHGGDPYDWFVLAMIEQERGNTQGATPWFDKSVAWMKEKKSHEADLLQLWTEAAKLLGQPGPEGRRETWIPCERKTMTGPVGLPGFVT